jgi:ABC-2 type transport system permease protein
VTIAVAGLLLLAVAAPTYGIPPVHDLGRVALGLLFGSIAFVSFGVLLGTLLPSARAAQAVGLILLFPSFLLGAGGPPPHVMGAALRHVGSVLPLTWVTTAIRQPWLGIGTPTAALLETVGLAVVATAVAARRAAL